MTYSEEFKPDNSANQGEPTGYFDAFGVQFTSTVLCFLIIIAGIGAAGALWWFLVKPIGAETQLLEEELQTKTAELQQKKASNNESKISELEAKLVQEQRIASEVINSYGKEKQVKTFLLDLSRILTASNIQLVSYEPTPSQPEFIEDDVYGESAKNKLKRQTFNVDFEDMTYAQAASMLENLDLLQPLVVLRNFSTNIAQRQVYTYNNNQIAPKGPTKLDISFVIDALVAPTPEEIQKRQEEVAKAEAEAAAADPAEGTKPKPGEKPADKAAPAEKPPAEPPK
jgi:type IV pilus assembly protein PilO